MASTSNYQLLIEKLDEFIRKYYVNQVIRGSLYSLALILALFLSLNFMEHTFYFEKGVRKVLFFSFLGISLVALTGWVLMPLLRYFRLGSVISHEQAAGIIGTHFGNVEDKLLNILQLKGQADSTPNADLILAGIDQKSETIKLVPFKKAIDLGENRRYLRYALPPLLLLLILLVAAPSIITDSTMRLLRNNQDFERPAPFKFLLDQEVLEVVEYGDFPLVVEIEGDELPNEVFIEVDKLQYRLTKEAANRFSYQFNKVQKDTPFRLYSTGVKSEDYTLNVLRKPAIQAFEVKLNYPAYIGRKDEALQNIGDLTVPAGTEITWLFDTRHTDKLQLRFASDEEYNDAARQGSELFTLKKKMLSDSRYTLFIGNENLPQGDSVHYSIQVVPDQYPSIDVERFQDSLQRKVIFFAGEASDDYGLSRLNFNYRITGSNGEQGPLEQLPMKKPGGKETAFTHTWDLEELGLAPGDHLMYYFEVFDNDGIQGAKSARTNLMTFNMPTVEEFRDMEKANNEDIKDRLKEAVQESKKVQEEMKELRDKLLQEKDLSWQQRKELQKLMDRQKELQNQIENAKQAFEENMENQKEFTEVDEKIAEKQEQLQKLFEEMADSEMMELMKQIEELLDELEKDGALDMMEQFEMNDQELEKEMDRMLELFKQLELEKMMEETIDELEKLAEEQEKLSEESEKGEMSQEELQEKQEEINDKFDELEEKMDEMKEKNEELEQPQDLGDQEEDKEEIRENLEDSKENLEKQQNKDAAKSQKKASDKMKEMANSMSMQMQAQSMEQMEEDMESLRQLLENLVRISFDQEDLMEEFSVVAINTPRYVDMVQDQFKLKDDFRLIEDTLQALSKRVFQIESFVTEKVMEINQNMGKSITELEERRKPQAGEHQQRIMKNANDLALMLSEVLNQMQQEMSGMMQGSQMCQKPGGSGAGGRKPKDKMSEGQQGLNEQMKKMKEGQEKGGDTPTSKEFAEIAAKQAALRQALQQKQKELQQQGKGGSQELQDLIDEMNKMETELVNKRLTNEMMKRQQDILTRLLEHEKAEREREYDNQRKSETAQEYERPVPPSLQEYLKKREAEVELYRTVSPTLKPYYRLLVEEYYKNLREDN